MKRICKKMIVTLLVVVLVFNFIINPFCFAGADWVRDFITSLLSTFVGVITWIPRVLALGLGYAIDAIASAIAYVDGTVSVNGVAAEKRLFITPFEIVFNEIAITNVDFFDFSGVGSDTVVYKIRTNVAGWYYFMRFIAVAILLVILVYVGIRMALSTIAEDKAKYKKMLVDWLASLALVFVLQYIMIFIIQLSNTLVTALGGTRKEGLETALNDVAKTALGASVEAIGATVVFFLFVYQTFSILFTYINRMIRVAFLIIISPLITITYSIDKMGDGKAQALNTWLKEFVTSILIQPFHCVIYMVFVLTAIELLQNPEDTGSSRLASAVIAILCMMFINDAENIVRKIFDLKGDDGASSIAKGAAIAGAALHKSKDLGKAARKGINFAKEAKPLETGKKIGREMRSAGSAALQTLKDGRKGPGFSANYNLKKASLEEKATEKKEEKAEKRYKSYENRVVGYTKDGKAITNKDKFEQRYNDMKNRPENKGLTDDQIRRKAKAEVVKEGRAKGDFSAAPIRGYRSVASKARKAGRAFSNSATGQVLKQNFQLATGIAAGSMALGSEDLFAAFATGAAVKNATQEFMSSSNSYIANEAAQYAEVLQMTSEGDILESYEKFKSGASEKERDDSEAALEKLLRSSKKPSGEDYTDADVDSILSSMKAGLERDPKADLNQIIANVLKTSASELENNMNQQLRDAMEQFKNATAMVSLGQTIDKGTSYGASAETLARATADRGFPDTPIAGDHRAVEDLYQVTNQIRQRSINESDARVIVKKVKSSGLNVNTFIARMERDKDDILRESNLDQRGKDELSKRYDANIQILKNVNNGTNP